MTNTDKLREHLIGAIATLDDYLQHKSPVELAAFVITCGHTIATLFAGTVNEIRHAVSEGAITPQEYQTHLRDDFNALAAGLRRLSDIVGAMSELAEMEGLSAELSAARHAIEMSLDGIVPPERVM